MLGLQSRPVRSETKPRWCSGLVRKFFSSAAALGIVAGAVSVSLVAAPAQADIGIAPLAPPVVEGAVEGVAGTVITGALVSNPIGWGVIGITGIGVGLYATKDYWLSYNPGALFFGDNSNTTADPATGAVIDPRVSLTAAAINTAQPWILDITTHVNLNPQQTSDQYYHASVHMKCNTKADGTGTALADTVVAPYTYYSSTIGATGAMHPQCTSGYITGAIIGATHADPLLTADNPGGGPTNVKRVGNMVSGTQSGNPRGATTTYYTSTDCIDSTGKIQTLTVNSTGDKGAVQMPSCAAHGMGHSTGAIRIDAFNSLDGSTTRVWETTTPAANPNEPLCATTLPGAGCKFQISIDGKPCVVGDIQCENWPTVDANDSAHTRVSCQHGPYTEPLASCNVLEKAYMPGGAPATDANTDGNPATKNYLDPNGNPIPQPQPVQAGTVPGDAGAPTTGTVPNPASTDSSDCFPSGWGVFNPVEWIQKPVGCALSWAFVPKGTTMTQLEAQVKADVDRVGFGPIQAAVVGMFAPLGSSGAGCMGPPVTFAMHGQNDMFYPFQACTAPMSIAAGVCNALTTMIFIIGGGMGLMRAISAAFGYNFSFGRGSAE